jgi:hypothetical protein
MLPRLAVVDHSFHQTTHSTKFIPELLQSHYTIDQLWDTSWQGQPNITSQQLNAGNYDVIVFVQTLLPLADMRQLRAKIIWVPMYVGVPVENWGFWLELSTLPIKVLSFSQTLATILRRYRIDTLAVQFYFNPADFPVVTDYSSLRIFFWQRTNLTFNIVRQLFAKLPVTHWVVKINPDPTHQAEVPTAADCERNRITLIQAGYGDKSQYLNLLQHCNVFICPRASEGIGMSFLEAMAMGLVPVALDRPTMNEYITPGVTGWLTQRFRPLPQFDVAQLGKNVRQAAEHGYGEWVKQQAQIVPWVQQPIRPPQTLTTLRRWRILFGTAVYYTRLAWRKLRRALGHTPI